MFCTNKTYSYGFTLIELLIVVAIIGILAAIAVPNFLSAQVRCNVARVEADMRTLSDALEQYRLDQNAYPYLYMCRWESNSTPPYSEYGTREQNRWELSVLTSPVAYLGFIPQDAFSPLHGPALGIDEGIESEAGSWPYDYTSFDAFSKINFDMSTKGYVLKSRGPDRKFNGGHWHYAVSNGLRSPGDIVRYEGGEQGGGWKVY